MTKSNLLRYQKSKRYFNPILILFLGCVILYITSGEGNASETLKNKVVYLNVDMEDGELKNDPFFAGLVIEETIEKPAINFDFPFENPPKIKIELEPDLRNKITSLKRENTFERIKTK